MFDWLILNILLGFLTDSFSLCMVRKYNPEIKLIYIGKQFIASILKPILVSKTFLPERSDSG